MKKQFIGATVLLVTISLTGCTATPVKNDETAKSDETACTTILSEATDFVSVHSKELKDLKNPFTLVKLIKPLTPTMDKAADQAKTKELSQALTKISGELKKDSPSILKLYTMEKDLKSINSICKTAGVDIAGKLKSLQAF